MMEIGNVRSGVYIVKVPANELSNRNLPSSNFMSLRRDQYAGRPASPLLHGDKRVSQSGYTNDQPSYANGNFRNGNSWNSSYGKQEFIPYRTISNVYNRWDTTMVSKFLKVQEGSNTPVVDAFLIGNPSSMHAVVNADATDVAGPASSCPAQLSITDGLVVSTIYDAGSAVADVPVSRSYPPDINTVTSASPKKIAVAPAELSAALTAVYDEIARCQVSDVGNVITDVCQFLRCGGAHAEWRHKAVQACPQEWANTGERWHWEGGEDKGRWVRREVEGASWNKGMCGRIGGYNDGQWVLKKTSCERDCVQDGTSSGRDYVHRWVKEGSNFGWNADIEGYDEPFGHCDKVTEYEEKCEDDPGMCNNNPKTPKSPAFNTNRWKPPGSKYWSGKQNYRIGGRYGPWGRNDDLVGFNDGWDGETYMVDKAVGEDNAIKGKRKWLKTDYPNHPDFDKGRSSPERPNTASSTDVAVGSDSEPGRTQNAQQKLNRWENNRGTHCPESGNPSVVTPTWNNYETTEPNQRFGGITSPNHGNNSHYGENVNKPPLASSQPPINYQNPSVQFYNTEPSYDSRLRGNPYQQRTSYPSEAQAGDPYKQQGGYPVNERGGDPYKQQAGYPTNESGGDPYKQPGSDPTNEKGGDPYKQQGGYPANERAGDPYKQQGGYPTNERFRHPYKQQGGYPTNERGRYPYKQQGGYPTNVRSGDPYKQQGGYPQKGRVGGPYKQQGGYPQKGRVGGPYKQQGGYPQKGRVGGPYEQQSSYPSKDLGGGPYQHQSGYPPNERGGDPYQRRSSYPQKEWDGDPYESQQSYPSKEGGSDPFKQQSGYPSKETGGDPQKQQNGYLSKDKGGDPQKQKNGYPSLNRGGDPSQQQGRWNEPNPTNRGSPNESQPPTWDTIPPVDEYGHEQNSSNVNVSTKPPPSANSITRKKSIDTPILMANRKSFNNFKDHARTSSDAHQSPMKTKPHTHSTPPNADKDPHGHSDHPNHQVSRTESHGHSDHPNHQVSRTGPHGHSKHPSHQFHPTVPHPPPEHPNHQVSRTHPHINNDHPSHHLVQSDPHLHMTGHQQNHSPKNQQEHIGTHSGHMEGNHTAIHPQYDGGKRHYDNIDLVHDINMEAALKAQDLPLSLAPKKKSSDNLEIEPDPIAMANRHSVTWVLDEDKPSDENSAGTPPPLRSSISKHQPSRLYASPSRDSRSSKPSHPLNHRNNPLSRKQSVVSQKLNARSSGLSFKASRNSDPSPVTRGSIKKSKPSLLQIRSSAHSRITKSPNRGNARISM